MLSSKTKRHIKLLAERYGHNIGYDKNSILLFNTTNSISVESTRKELLRIRYNSTDDLEEIIEVHSSLVYDPLINLFRRSSPDKIETRSNIPIQLKDFLEEEFISKRTIPELKHEWYTNQIEHKVLGGNRIEAEYFKGVIILIDDLPNGMLSNVVDIKIDEL